MAEKLLRLEVVAPDHQALSVDAESVVVRTIDGELGFLTGHAPLIAGLVPHVLRYVDADGKQQYIAIGGGFVEVLNNVVSVMSPSAETAEQIDYERAERAKARAEERLSTRENIDIARAQAALARATTRLTMKQYL